MASISIDRVGCRSCRMCVDICPTQVFVLGTGSIPEVSHPEDCIGCESCRNLCPSRCLEVSDIKKQSPFYRVVDDVALVNRFLRARPLGAEIGEHEWEGALRDVAVRLGGLADSIVETMGRGQRAVGRKAGKLAAEHLPEMYEGCRVSEVLLRLRQRMRGAFEFEYQVSSDSQSISITMTRCAVTRVAGVSQVPGKVAVVCELFHEYWAGLLGAFVSRNYQISLDRSGCLCAFTLSVR